MKSRCNNSRGGFTLLELLAVLAIIATASLFGLPAIQEWNAKKSFNKVVNDVYTELSNVRLEALSRSTITKIVTSRNVDTYTITLFYNTTASAACGSANGWTQLSTTSVMVNNNFEITGSGIGNVCFLRDGTSSGGIYNIVQKNGQTNLGNSTINVMLATGFIDVTKN